jgi:predicted ATPase
VAARYGFRHALYQEVLYAQISLSRRTRLHRQIGEREEQGYGARAREIAAELAVHFERGRDYHKAVQYLQQAGLRATARSAYGEAIGHLRRGLELRRALPDTPEGIQQELTLQLALNDALLAVKGYTAPEVEKAVTRARELCQQLDETPQLLPVLWRLWLFYLNRGELRTALELAEQLMRLAQNTNDPYLLSVAHEALGCTLHWLGELTSARTHLEQAIALYDPQTPPRITIGTADPRINCLSYLAWTLWYLGYPDQALKRSQEEVALAAGLSHPYSLAYALGHAASLHLLRREGPLVRERAEAVITLSTEQGFPYWLAQGMMMQGGALAEQGQAEEGITQMQQGLAAFRATRAEAGQLTHLLGLAPAYAKVGRVEEGLSVVVEALTVANKTGRHFHEAELYRLKGEFTLQKFQVSSSKFQVLPSPQPLTSSTQAGAEQEAEGYFLKAIDIARKQRAKSWELRATMSLARLWQQQGKQQEAHHLLSAIYGWFTEGFDTKDLQEAKALLEELA